MRIRRIHLSLPARLSKTAAADARMIAEAAARALQDGGSPPIGSVRIEGAGRAGATLALDVGNRLRPPFSSHKNSGEG